MAEITKQQQDYQAAILAGIIAHYGLAPMSISGDLTLSDLDEDRWGEAFPLIARIASMLEQQDLA
jgi:hypothetical protein